MKTKILSLAIASIFAFGTTAFAQAPADTAKTECKKDCKHKCHKKKDSKCDRKGCDRNAPNPFEGITLTQQQQDALAAIPTPCQVMKAARDNKNACDSAATCTPESRRGFVRDVRLNYLAQVKAILSPEQYVQFLENCFASQKVAKADKKGHKHGKKHAKGKKARSEGRTHADARRR